MSFFLWILLFRTVLFPALPYHFLANPTGRPFRHPLSRATLPLRPASGGLASPPFQSGVRPRKIPPWIFLGIGDLQRKSPGC